MLTFLEILMIAANIPVLIWALLPVKRIPRFLDFMPLSAVFFMVLHLLVDNEPVKFRFISLYIFIVTVFLITVIRIFRHNHEQPKSRVLAVFGRLSALLALAFSVMVPVAVLPFNALPEPTGSFNTGTVVYSFTDENRTELFAKEAGQYRKIAVQFWYPTDRTESKPAHDIIGAPVSTVLQKYPVVIFSHGAFGIRMSNASTFRELASHGYIVASIDHTYHSFYSSFPDGNFVPANMDFLNNAVAVTNNKLTREETNSITNEWLNLRTGDIEFLIDSLKDGGLVAGTEMLTDHMDLDRIGLFGHSLGGAASAEVMRNREDIDAAIVIDGTMIGDITGLDSDGKEIIENKSINKPLMLMYNSSFLEPEAKADSYLPNIMAFENSEAAAYSLCIKASGHLNFTDLPRISPLLSGMLGVGPVDSLECIKLMNDYTLAFFERHINGKASTLLNDELDNKDIVFENKLP